MAGQKEDLKFSDNGQVLLVNRGNKGACYHKYLKICQFCQFANLVFQMVHIEMRYMVRNLR